MDTLKQKVPKSEQKCNNQSNLNITRWPRSTYHDREE